MALFYKAKPRQFNYNPRYYDPEKERREQRREELLGKRIEEGEYQPGDIIRSGGMRAKGRLLHDPEFKSRIQRGQTTRLIVILALMLAVVAIIFFL